MNDIELGEIDSENNNLDIDSEEFEYQSISTESIIVVLGIFFIILFFFNIFNIFN